MRLLYVLFTVLITAVSLYAQSYPSYFALSSNSPTCDGQTFKLSVTYFSPPSGTSISFRWSGPNSFTSSSFGALNVPASAATAGVYSVTMTFSGTNNGTATASTTVSLGTPKPDATAKYGGFYSSYGTAICSPGSITLAVTSSSPATYQWTGPGGYSSTEQNPVVAQGVAGLYIVDATYPNGCGTGKDTITVREYKPVISADSYTTGPNPQFSTSFCPGGSVKFQTSTEVPPAGTTLAYQWSGPNGFTSNAQSFTLNNLTTAMAGSYSVTTTFSGACSLTATASRSIQVGAPSVSAYSSVVVPGGSGGYSSSAYCPGADVRVDAYPVGGIAYQWSGPNGFTSSAQSFTLTDLSSALSGAYSVTVTLSGGCSNTAVATVGVGTPVLYVDSYTVEQNYSNATSFCPGSSARFLADISGSTATYRWSGPNGFTSTAQSFTLTNLTPSMAGTYSVTATLTGACSGTVLTKSQTIQVGSPSVGIYSVDESGGGGSGYTTFCPGTNVRVYAYPTNAQAYQWRGPNGFTSTAQSFTLANATPAMSGAYSVTVTTAEGCSNTAVANVTIGDPTLFVYSSTLAQVPSFTSSFCPGTSVRLLASVLNGTTATYRWSGPNGFVSTASSITLTNVTTAMSGPYSVTATFTGGCTGVVLTKTQTIQVGTPAVYAGSGNVGSNATQSTNTFCPGSAFRVEAFPVGPGISYRWSGPNSFTSLAQSFTLTNATAVLTGAYSLTVTFAEGCTNTAAANVAIGTPSVYATSRTVGANPVYSTAFCSESSFQISASSSGDATATYQWRGPNGFTSTAPSFTLTNATAAMTGTYSVTATYSGACSGTASASTYVRIGVNTPLVTASNAFVAPNQTVTLMASGCDSFNEQTIWSTGATGNTLIVTPAQSMTYSAVCRLNNGGCNGATSNIISVTVTNAPPVDLRIAMQLSTRTPDVNKPVVVTVFLENRSNQDATGVRWRCRLPGAVAFVAREPGVAFFEGVVTGNPAMVAANSTLPFSFTVMPTTNATYRLASQIIASDNPDPDATPDYGTNSGQKYVATVDFRTTGATTNLVFSSPEPNPAQLPPVASNQPTVAEGFSDLSLGIQTSTLTPTLNGEVVVTIKVASRGYYFEEQAQVRCQLPPGISFISSSDFTASGNVLTSASRTVYSYAFTSLAFRARITQPGQLTILAEIFSAGRPDPDSTPNNGYDNGEDDTAQISLRTGGL